MYFPSRAWNAYQLWADYDPAEIERDVGFASRLGLNALRIYASYEFWKPPERGPVFLDRLEHFVATCADRGIRPLVVLFEGTPQHPPTEKHLEDRDPATARGVHSPARELTRNGNWRDGPRSPLRFTAAVAERFGEDPRLLALSIANEPFQGGRMSLRFLEDVAERIREVAPDTVLTLGSAELPTARRFGDLADELDVHGFHENVPANETVARTVFALAGRHGSRTSTPVWLGEWQRLGDRPPGIAAGIAGVAGLDIGERDPDAHPMRPDPGSMAPLVADACHEDRIQGHFLWGLMLKPGYLLGARRQGRVNGLFHETGAVFDKEAADTIAGYDTGLSEYRGYPYRFASHPHPYDLLPVDRSD